MAEKTSNGQLAAVFGVEGDVPALDLLVQHLRDGDGDGDGAVRGQGDVLLGAVYVSVTVVALPSMRPMLTSCVVDAPPPRVTGLSLRLALTLAELVDFAPTVTAVDTVSVTALETARVVSVSV
nr:hypothetical protein [Streptacidiphilus rugosus]